MTAFVIFMKEGIQGYQRIAFVSSKKAGRARTQNKARPLNKKNRKQGM